MALGACELSLYEMLWGYTIFPSGGYSSRPYYIVRIEDKHGNMLGPFRHRTGKKAISPSRRPYTMARMMQGTVDYGTARGLRQRLGHRHRWEARPAPPTIIPTPGSSDTPRSCWQEPGIGCRRPLHPPGERAGDRRRSRPPIWEYFFSKALADKTLGLK